MTFEDFRKSFYYGRYSDMQFKFLARMDDEPAAEALAGVLARLGEALDTGDLAAVGQAVYEAQVAAYAEDSAPTVDDAPFAPLPGELANLRLALMSAGGVFRVGDDPMGPDGPTQQESLTMIKDFLRGAPTLSVIPKDTPDSAITARHPGYDARTAQRDPGTVFPLGVLRALEAEGALRLAGDHYAFTGATSQVRLREQVAPEWA
jgi:Glycine/sarcosine/betaine reductase selenoprotein B (GRDB)